MATQVISGNRDVRGPKTTAPVSPTAGNPHLRALLPALQRLDQLLEWALNAMQTSGVQAAPPIWRGLYIDEDEVRRLLAREPAQPPFAGQRPNGGEPEWEAPLNRLIVSFGLSSFDADLIVLAAAPELDLRYERLYAYLQDDVTRKRPTVELALNLLCSSAEEKLTRREHMEGQSPLVGQGLLQILPDSNQSSPPFLAHYLRVDNQVIRYLLGQEVLDSQLAACCELVRPKLDWDGLWNEVELKTALPALLQPRGDGDVPVLYFQGRSGTGKRKAAQALAGTLGTELLAVDLDRLADAPDFESRLESVLREACLRGCLLYLSGVDGLRSDAHAKQRDMMLRRLSRYPGSLILSGAQPWVSGGGLAALTIPFEIPEFEGRRARWEAELGAIGVCFQETELDSLGGRFRLTAAQIQEAVSSALNISRWRAAKSGDGGSAVVPTLDEVYSCARSETGHQLSKLAKKINPRHGWEDIVLPADQLTQLREICLQAQYRHIVYDAWGFDRKLSLGKGLNVLFFGPPGTGKTMSAEVIARELKLDVYRIDLSQIISKYIGETEKNLDQIFTAAENSNAILFFDEADALFGKRSEVRDSHDRYANIEISYLLQKMEEYQGVSILATNLRQNLDEAFVRRLQAIVEFPFPDEEYRRRIWQIAFPREAPLGDDVEFERLAREVRLAGGNIKNMAVAAAFYAAADGGTIHMPHLLQAARREHQKLGRAWNEAAFRPSVRARVAV